MTEPNLATLQAQVDALDRFLTAQLESQDKQVQLALASAEKAITKAETATEKRFEGVNEFRQTLADANANFALKTTVDTQFDAMREKIDDLNAAVARLLISLLVTIVGALIAALVFAATR